MSEPDPKTAANVLPPGCGINTTSQTFELVPGAPVTQMVVNSVTPGKCSLMGIFLKGKEVLSISKPDEKGDATILVFGEAPDCPHCGYKFYLDLSGEDLKPLRDYMDGKL